jgi:hypothetical protein
VKQTNSFPSNLHRWRNRQRCRRPVHTPPHHHAPIAQLLAQGTKLPFEAANLRLKTSHSVLQAAEPYPLAEVMGPGFLRRSALPAGLSLRKSKFCARRWMALAIPHGPVALIVSDGVRRISSAGFGGPSSPPSPAGPGTNPGMKKGSLPEWPADPEKRLTDSESETTTLGAGPMMPARARSRRLRREPLGGSGAGILRAPLRRAPPSME